MSTEEQPTVGTSEEVPNTTPQNTGVAPKLARYVGPQVLDSSQLMIPTNADERVHVHQTHGEDSWQAKILRIIHSNTVQYLLMGLLLLDVVILFVELYLTAEFPSCSIIERDAISCCMTDGGDDNVRRWLEGDTKDHELCEEGAASDYAAGCDEYKYSQVHTVDLVLRIMTIAILSSFAIELVILMAACGVKTFFSNFFYILDLVVVSISLALEILFLILDEAQLELLVGILILSRLWRFVRIGHGIFATTYELSSKQHQGHHKYNKKLEAILKENGIPLPDEE